MDNSRRKALTGIGGLALSATSTLLAAPVFSNEKVSSVPWEYKELDSNLVAARAYRGYHKHGCMYAVFEAIIGELADRFGTPYSTFPFEMMSYGASGVASWGTLCGTLNGAAAAIGLVSKNPRKLINELYIWSEETALPNVDVAILSSNNSNTPNPVKGVSSISGSVLCHIIVAKWCKKSKKGIDSYEKKQRCSQSAASVAKKTVELLNAELNGTFKTQYRFTQETKSCFKCHTGTTSVKNNSQGKMQCTTCHTNLTGIHNL
ncbi:MAG: C_GCAxxG_C_C family protein [Arcobacteraceae bacterium]|nr:C_GCAxxG_C_C family protein [Arcobacteraceae bacterium]